MTLFPAGVRLAVALAFLFLAPCSAEPQSGLVELAIQTAARGTVAINVEVAVTPDELASHVAVGEASSLRRALAGVDGGDGSGVIGGTAKSNPSLRPIVP